MTVEIHIAVERLWDMRSTHEYAWSPDLTEVSLDEEGTLVVPAVPVEELLILKLLPLRDRDVVDIIALILDNPDMDAAAFWRHCQRTGNEAHISKRLDELAQMLNSGTFRDVWQAEYGEPLSLAQVRVVLDRVRKLKRSKL